MVAWFLQLGLLMTIFSWTNKSMRISFHQIFMLWGHRFRGCNQWIILCWRDYQVSFFWDLLSSAKYDIGYKYIACSLILWPSLTFYHDVPVLWPDWLVTQAFLWIYIMYTKSLVEEGQFKFGFPRSFTTSIEPTNIYIEPHPNTWNKTRTLISLFN